MELVTVRFDRVFDVVHGMHDRRTATFFGFQCGAKRVWGVHVFGKHSIEAGMVVTACLMSAGNWETLAGWYNHGNGEVVAESMDYHVFGFILSLLLLGSFAAAMKLSGAAILPMAYAFFLLVSHVYALRLIRKVRRELESLRNRPVPEIECATDAMTKAADEGTARPSSGSQPTEGK